MFQGQRVTHNGGAGIGGQADGTQGGVVSLERNWHAKNVLTEGSGAEGESS